MTVVPDPEAALDAAVAADAGRRDALRAADLHGDAGPARDPGAARASRRRSGVSDDGTRRAASRSSTPTTPRTSASGARPPPAAGRRCSTWAAPPAGSRSRWRATAPRSGRSTARRRCCAELRPPPRGRAAGRARAACSPCAATWRSRDLDLPGGFRLVLVAMNTLQVLTEPADRVGLPARRARRTWPPGGELIFDVALPDADEIVATMGVERPGGRHRDRRAAPCCSTRPGTTAGSPATQTLEFTLRIEQRRRRGPPRAAAPSPRAPLHAGGDRRSCSPRPGSSRSRSPATSTARRATATRERQIHRCRAAA